LKFLNPHLAGVLVIARENGSLMRLQSGDYARPRTEPPAELASINYTYRGYGYPLGAMVTHEQYLHGARVLQDGLQGRRGERMLTMLPMAHIFTLVGCILVPLLYGMTCVIASLMNPRRLFERVSELGIEYITSVPQILALLARTRDPSDDLSCLKAFVSGGCSLEPADYQSIREAFCVELLHGYGLTEFTPVSRNMRGQARPGTVGPVCDGVDCRIDGPSPAGVGEILVRAPRTGCTYLNRPLESAQALRGGWFRTGDLGRFEGDHLVFAEELKRTRKVNGNIVDLEEVSRAIRLDREVEEVLVSGEGGELVARIALSGRIDFREKVKQLKSSLRQAIAEYKIPKRMEAL
jgi:long-chain acyl-CoA synthetase